MGLLTRFKLRFSRRSIQSVKKRLDDKHLESIARYLRVYVRWGDNPVKLQIQVNNRGTTYTTIRPKKGPYGVGYHKPSFLLSKVLGEIDRRKRRRESIQASTG